MSKFQLFGSNKDGMDVSKILENDHQLNNRFTYNAVFRTALASPGCLTIKNIFKKNHYLVDEIIIGFKAQYKLFLLLPPLPIISLLC